MDLALTHLGFIIFCVILCHSEFGMLLGRCLCGRILEHTLCSWLMCIFQLLCGNPIRVEAMGCMVVSIDYQPLLHILFWYHLREQH